MPMRLAVTTMVLGALLAQARTVRVAVCQILAIDGGREGNFRRVEYALEDARAAHADIAAFPESVILGWENPDAHRIATPIPGADSDRIAALARKYGLMISIGLDEKDGDKLYDSAILVDKSGKILWKHRKLNVLAWLMDPPYSEGQQDGIGVTETEFGRIGLVILRGHVRGPDCGANREAGARSDAGALRLGGADRQVARAREGAGDSGG